MQPLAGIRTIDQLDDDFNKAFAGGGKPWRSVQIVALVNFSNIMDYFGHDAGDESVAKIAALLQKTHPDKAVYRIAYPRFLVVDPDRSDAEAWKGVRCGAERESVNTLTVGIDTGQSLAGAIASSDEFLRKMCEYRLDDRPGGYSKQKVVVHLR